MGKSDNVKNAEKANADFQKFLSTITEKLEKDSAKEAADFDKNVKEFYESSNYDYLIISQGEKWDYHLLSECGINALKEKVKEMINSFFGIADIPAADSKVEIDKTENGSVFVETTTEVMAALKTLSLFKNLAATAATNFLIGMFDMFSDKLEISTTHDYSSQPIAPGLTLHVDLFTAAYTNEQFLKSDKIIEHYVKFKLVYSYALAGTVSAMDTLTILSGKISQQERILADFDVKLFQLMSDMNSDINMLMLYQVRSKMMHDYLNEAKAECNKVIADHMMHIVSNNESSTNMVKAGLLIPKERRDMMNELLSVYR